MCHGVADQARIENRLLAAVYAAFGHYFAIKDCNLESSSMKTQNNMQVSDIANEGVNGQDQKTMPAVKHYQAQISTIEVDISKRQELMKRLVWLRLLLALLGFGLLGFGLIEKTASPWIWKIGVVFIFAFLVAATWHETNVWIVSILNQRLRGYKRLVARCARDWKSLPPLPSEVVSPKYHSELSRDLDLFGDRSLYRWVSLATTQTGAKTVCDWMMYWAPPSEITDRQKAVQELVLQRDWRMAFFENACNYQQQLSGPEGIVEWSASPSHFANRRWLQMLTWVSPMMFFVGIVLILLFKYSENDLGQTIGLGMMLGGAAVNFLLTMGIIGPIHDTFQKIGAANRELQSLREMISRIEKLPCQSRLLIRAKSLCQNDDHSADLALARLQRIMSLAGMQRSPLMFIPYLLLQVGVLWDVRVLELLEHWKVQNGEKTQGWLDSIGVIETLCASAAIADEYPNWMYPQLHDRNDHLSERLLEIKCIAHPLLNDSSRVNNDVSIDRSHPLLLVTGSNMAGKSTLLRSIGVNAILARLGAPVCANSWISASLDLASSIRVQDSLQDGVSFFMAELRRLRDVVETAKAQDHAAGRPMLVLLDEILQGTNSRERQIAVEHVLDCLVRYGCIVITSTHDLEMAGNPSIQRIAQTVHFREHFVNENGKQVMKFDYIMHPGVTPTTNALKLLEMVGLRATS